ncbi:MAG: TetR/AcrR family transcriptional regulator [Gammaproteobacteria bacterium]|nr:MAG: TetR/AcrR family transcriptional regulator [Gammaproteobacteria bacterium]
MNKTGKTDSPRERIVATASDLFYTQGYRATGINEVIKQSGVAKATFYSHFPSKDDLCLAYLEERSLAEKRGITERVQSKRSPRAKFLAVMESILPWMESNNLRGCEYLNTVAEVPDPSSPLRLRGHKHYQWLHGLIKELADDLLASDIERYKGLNAKNLSDDYMVVLVGAIALSEVHHDSWPIKHAIKMVRQMID